MLLRMKPMVSSSSSSARLLRGPSPTPAIGRLSLIGRAFGASVPTRQAAPLEAVRVIEDQSGLEPLSGPMSVVKTRKLELPNGLRAYLISDPGSHQCAASLSVETGSWNDHRDHQGTAHFLEHMLFLGTSKFPSENEYTRFVSENGGVTNAYTSSDHTVYGFKVNPSAFEGAMDRFSQFFISPLFNESCVEREMIAVDQEFRKNIESDSWRNVHVSKELARPEHPYSYFNTGHLESMKKLNLQTLRDWYATYYCGGSMSLAVYANHSLDDLQRLVIEFFSQVKPSEAGASSSPPSWGAIFPPTAFGNKVYISPIRDTRRCGLLWEIPGEFCHPDSKIADTLSHSGPLSPPPFSVKASFE